MFKRRCKITFIAHGTTIYSEENRVTDKLDYPPLNEVGYEQVSKILNFIKQRGLKTDKIFSAPTLCCTQSAEMFADELNQDFEIAENLYNRKCGALEGLTFNQIEKKYCPRDNESGINIFQISPENGENISEFNLRIRKAVSSIIEQNLNKRIIVVTHPSVIKSVIANALAIPENNQYKIHIKYASATQISYFENWASLVYSDYVPY